MTAREPGDDTDLFTQIGADPRSHEIMLEQAARLAKLGYFVFDIEQSIVELCSERHAAIFGHTPQDFIALVTGLRGEMTMIHPEDKELIREGYDRLRAGRHIDLEYRFFRKDGSIGHVREFVAPERAADGRVVRGLGSSIDVTEIREKEQKRAQADRLTALGELTAGVAHDFNNLLAVIMGNAELIGDVSNDPELAHFVTEIVKATRRGATLTASLLNFAQRAPVSPRPVELNSEAEAALAVFERTSLRKATCRFSAHATPLYAHLDRDQLQAVLLNLLLNARDAIEPGGNIEIAVRALETVGDPSRARRLDLAPGRFGVIEVVDSGHGIPPGLMARVTEPFFTTKSRAEGSGLGLSMAQGFARQAGGALDLRSEHGAGTSVSICFPLTDPPAAPMEKTPTAELRNRQNRILLVEDEASLRETLQRQLRQTGFQVETAQDGQTALALLTERAFDIALLDNILPGRHRGTDIARLARQADPTLKTILLSGMIEEDASQLSDAADAVLHKPAPFQEILATINRLLDS